ncbi:MAG: hypothetical protein QXR53_01810 [Candidatus Norongarragalinales archaeon]
MLELLSFIPVFLFDFIEALTVVIIIIDFIMVYKYFYPEVVGSQILGIVITTIITFLLIIPYPFMAWVVFFITFAYSFFWGFQPWTWAKDEPLEGDRQTAEQGP